MALKGSGKLLNCEQTTLLRIKDNRFARAGDRLPHTLQTKSGCQSAPGREYSPLNIPFQQMTMNCRRVYIARS